MKCMTCGIETKNPKFCSTSCAAMLNNIGRVHSEESKKKASISLKGRQGWAKGTKVHPDIIKKRKEGFTAEKRKIAAVKASISLRKRRELYVVPMIESDALMEGKWSLRRYLIEKNNKCRKCGISDWQEEPIVLEIHHLDGNKKNNRFSNVTLLCPNCHSQTHNFRNKNRNAYTNKQEEDHESSILG